MTGLQVQCVGTHLVPGPKSAVNVGSTSMGGYDLLWSAQ